MSTRTLFDSPRLSAGFAVPASNRRRCKVMSAQPTRRSSSDPIRRWCALFLNLEKGTREATLSKRSDLLGGHFKAEGVPSVGLQRCWAKFSAADFPSKDERRRSPDRNDGSPSSAYPTHRIRWKPPIRTCCPAGCRV